MIAPKGKPEIGELRNEVGAIRFLAKMLAESVESRLVSAEADHVYDVARKMIFDSAGRWESTKDVTPMEGAAYLLTRNWPDGTTSDPCLAVWNCGRWDLKGGEMLPTNDSPPDQIMIWWTTTFREGD